MTFTKLTARLKNFLRGWLLISGLKEGMVECGTVFIKSEVILIIVFGIIEGRPPIRGSNFWYRDCLANAKAASLPLPCYLYIIGSSSYCVFSLPPFFVCKEAPQKWYIFCYQNCSDLLWETIVLVIEKNFWKSRLKAKDLQNCWDHKNNLFKQWKFRTIFGSRMFF